jgi:3-isopropylmalate dehydrogenase
LNTKTEKDLTNVKPRLCDVIEGYPDNFDASAIHNIGVLVGEGVGVEVVPAALELLEILQKHTARKFVLHYGGAIGADAKKVCGSGLSSEVIDFTKDIFSKNGALFCGPGGERFVYEMRKEFDLFCKFTPLEPFEELSDAGVVKKQTVLDTDIIAVRENSGGIYQGSWSSTKDDNGEIVASHSFLYTKSMVERVLQVAMELASRRRKRVHIVLKPGGVPTITELWRECADEMLKQYDIKLFEHEIDNAVYQMIANPAQFDVIVSPNLFGDVLADCGSLLLSSRGLSYSGNFNDNGNAVYQTGHGAAKDIAGKGIANPIGQILSLGMMLRESFCWGEADIALREALRATLREKICTRDIIVPGAEIVGTQVFTDNVKFNLQKYLEGKTI